MKTIIAGSRTCTDEKILFAALKFVDWEITEILCGMARGADMLGFHRGSSLGIPVKRYPANWHKHGRGAGYIRNAEMADDAEALIALWDGKSRGTKHMIEIARCKGLKIVTYLIHKKTASDSSGKGLPPA